MKAEEETFLRVIVRILGINLLIGSRVSSLRGEKNDDDCR